MNNKLDNALNTFGLTLYESKVYRALTSEGLSTAKEISNISSIPYGKIYEVISSLSKKGFIETLPTKPMKYNASNPEKVIKAVKGKIISNLEKSEELIIKQLKPSFEKTKKFIDSKANFWVINGRNAVTKKIEEMLKRTKSNLNIHTTEKGIARLSVYNKLLRNLNKNGVNIKISTLITKNNKKALNNLNFCSIVNSKINYSSTYISVDNSETFIFESIPDDGNMFYGRDVGLWASNPSFTHFMDTLFISNFENVGER